MRLVSLAWRVLGPMLIVAAVGAACGDGGAVRGPQPGAEPATLAARRPASPSASPPAASAAAAEEASEPAANPRWELVAPHFGRFVATPRDARKDVFRSRLAPDLPAPPGPPAPAGALASGLDASPSAAAGAHPLRRFPASDFARVAALTGTGAPSALVRDPRGNAFRVAVDDVVGAEGGVVTAITPYELAIALPDGSAPLRLSVSPGLFDVSRRQLEERALR